MSLVPKLGIGLLHQEELRPFIEQRHGLFDFIEVIPDLYWTDLGWGKHDRYVENHKRIAKLRQLGSEVPIVLHSIGLSIGSAYRFDREHVSQIARWRDWVKFPWHSDHLAYLMAEYENGETNVGVTMPLPFDQESVDLLASRVREVRAQIPTPFLLETNVYFFKYPRPEMDEAEFLNRLCEQSRGHLLLDLHNLYTNSRNLKTDPYAFLEKLNLANVVEIHMAGGFAIDGFYQDAHSNTSPRAVWNLLDWVLPKCPNLGGVVFELLGSWYVDVGEDRLLRQLSRMKEMWARYQPTPRVEVAA